LEWKDLQLKLCAFCFFVVFLSLFLAPLFPEDYRITQAQMEKLQRICQDYKDSRRIQQEQSLTLQKKLDSFLEKSKTLQTKAESLETQLKAEREQTQSLTDSYQKSLASHLQTESEQQKEIESLNKKVSSLRKYSIILSSVIIFFILLTIICVILKIRKIF
jgi:Skp family chaperone for outer membrane proteins